MGEFREILDREGERFDQPPGGLERLQRRHRHRQRTRRFGAGVVALGLAVGGTVLVVSAFQGTPARRSAEQPRVAHTSAISVRPVDLVAGEGAVWVVSAAQRAVVRLDPGTGGVVDEIPIPAELGHPVGVAVANGSLWVQTGFAERPDGIVVPAVVQIDAATNRIVSTLRLDHSSHPAMAVGAGAVWTASSETGVVSRRDLPQGRVTAITQGPVPPVALAFGQGDVWSLGGGRGHVEPPIPGTIARIDPTSASVTSSAEVGPSPRDMAIGAGAVWVVDAVERALIRIDAATVSVTDRIPLTGLPTEVAVGPTGAWALDIADGVLFRIDPNDGRVTGSVGVGPDPVALSTDQKSVWVARSDGTILRIEG
jgi:virginiamycin B lyase